MPIYVQFEDSKKKVITAWFRNKPREDSPEENLGEVEADDPRLLEYVKPFSEDLRAAMLTPTE